MNYIFRNYLGNKLNYTILIIAVCSEMNLKKKEEKFRKCNEKKNKTLKRNIYVD